MAKRYDATTKHLVEAHPADWLALAGLPTTGPVRMVDADVSTVTAAADKVVRVEGPAPYITHIELQSGREPDQDLRALGYNVPLRVRHRLPVWSVVFLLRPAADGPGATGRVYDVPANLPGFDPACGDALLEFRYRLVRVWERPVDAILAGGLGTLPLAPISAVPPARVPAVVEVARQRMANEAPPGEARELVAAMSILMGLRYSRGQVSEWLRGVRHMEESDTYQAILEKGIEKGLETGLTRGQVDGTRATLIRLGRKLLGPPDAATVAALVAIADLNRLEALTDRLGDRNVASWDDLLEAGA